MFAEQTEKTNISRSKATSNRAPKCCGFLPTDQVLSEHGWRAVSELKLGERVVTFDNGLQEIVDIERIVLMPDATIIPPEFWPVSIPENTLGDHPALMLLPDQGVLLEHQYVLDHMGDPFAILPVHALIGVRGIERREPLYQMEQTSLRFARDEVVCMRGGPWMYCPADPTKTRTGVMCCDPLYLTLTGAEARNLVVENVEQAEQALMRTSRYTIDQRIMATAA